MANHPNRGPVPAHLVDIAAAAMPFPSSMITRGSLASAIRAVLRGYVGAIAYEHGRSPAWEMAGQAACHRIARLVGADYESIMFDPEFIAAAGQGGMSDLRDAFEVFGDRLRRDGAVLWFSELPDDREDHIW